MTLCILPVIPSPMGDGASQRAWYTLNALAKAGTVDLVVLQQTDRPELSAVSLDAARGIARTMRVVPVPSWCTTSAIVRHVPQSVGRVLDLARIGSVETPRLSPAALRQIASHLPEFVDTLFVGRLSTACIVDDLCRAGLLRARRRIVDFDDIMSRFRRLQIRQAARRAGSLMHHWQSFIAARMEGAEARIARTWDACTVASSEDVGVLEAAHQGVRVYHLPNVVDHVPVKAAVAARKDAGDEALRLLFVGNLTYPPNVEGLCYFLNRVWPMIRRIDPLITLSVVGRDPDRQLADTIRSSGAMLHANVPDVRPHYAAADAVIAPIFFGGGTRVKIVEAMAMGKPVVSTPFGVEGLAVRHGVHALLGKTAEELAAAIRSLATNPGLGHRLARAARALQHERYSSAALEKAVARLLQAPVAAARVSTGLREGLFGGSLGIDHGRVAWA